MRFFFNKLFFCCFFSFILFNFLFCYRGETSHSKKTGEKVAEKVRKPAVAGQFYTADSLELTKEIASYFKKAKKEEIPGEIVALISPHAGYMYSGQVAAYGYKSLEGLKFDNVVVISPSHTAYFSGASIYDGTGYQTPLGVIPVNTDLAKKIGSYDKNVYLSDKGHSFSSGRGEHSLEVQLPFLQIVLGKFKLVPIVMGEQNWETCISLGNAIAQGLKGENALIVASSDLSHFHPYNEAVRLDNIVIADVNNFDEKALFEHLEAGRCEACGGGPMVSAMIAAKTLGANHCKVVKYANSGDVTGDKSGVVGYMSAVMYSTKKANSPKTKLEKEEKKVGVDLGLSDKDKATLIDIAKKTIEAKVKGEKLPDFKVTSEILKEKRGAFVTIKKQGHLRGCIGYIQAVKPLYITIQDMAEAAALQDPRFPPVAPSELKDLELEISVLTPLRKISNVGEIQVGKHGIYMKKGFYSGLLLPQVATEYKWDRNTFLEETCYKAGLDKDCWKEKDTQIFIFSADIF